LLTVPYSHADFSQEFDLDAVAATERDGVLAGLKVSDDVDFVAVRSSLSRKASAAAAAAALSSAMNDDDPEPAAGSGAAAPSAAEEVAAGSTSRRRSVTFAGADSKAGPGAAKAAKAEAKVAKLSSTKGEAYDWSLV